jgi:hypothetical protein
MATTTIEDQKRDIFNEIYNLEMSLESSSLSYEDKDNVRFEISELRDDYRDLCKRDCIAEGLHFNKTTSSGGFDVCLNCGGRN